MLSLGFTRSVVFFCIEQVISYALCRLRHIYFFITLHMKKNSPVLILCLVFTLLCVGCATQAPQATRPVQPVPVPVVKTKDVPSFGQIMEYIQKNMTSIVSSSISGPPANGTRFTQGFGFISPELFYVDFEDGHYAYTALLECEYD